MPKSNYQKYLDTVHAKYTIPQEVVIDVVKKASGFPPLSFKRIVSGEVNEVYDVSVKDDLNLIVRIGREEDTNFKKEKWAFDKVSPLGVPVPEFLLIDEIEIDKKPLKICVQKKIEGEPLERGAINYSKMDKRELRKIINEAGKILSRIHKVKVNGFGDLNEKGIGDSPTFKDFMSEHVNQNDLYLNCAKKVGFDQGVLKAIFEILKLKAKTVPEITPVLNHDDFGPKHIMVKDGRITGILDWAVVGHSPINDFSRWAFWYNDIPLEWLMEGYENKDLFGKDFPDMLHWILLNNSLNTMWWYFEKRYFEGVKDLVHRITPSLDFFTK